MNHYKFAHILKLLKKARLDNGLTQAQLAKVLVVPQSYVSELEAGARDPRLGTVLEWSRALGLELVLIPKQLLLAVNEITSNVDSLESDEHQSPFKALPEEP
jgi:transcriptional regulator with XRE-family HTH domain